MEGQWTTVEGLRIHAWTIAGPTPDAPVVVLVPGLGLSGEYLLPVARELSERFRVFAVDMPGFGKSEKPRRVLDVTGLGDFAAAWMGAVGLERVALIGSSFGCQVVADVLVHHPDYVERGVLVGPTIDPRHRNPVQQVARLLLDGRREGSPPTLFADYRKAGLRSLLCTAYYTFRDRIEDKLPNVQVPTLVVRGGRDPVVPQRWAEEATGLLPQGWLVVVPNVAHNVILNAIPQFLQVAVPFLHGEAPYEPRRRTS